MGFNSPLGDWKDSRLYIFCLLHPYQNLFQFSKNEHELLLKIIIQCSGNWKQKLRVLGKIFYESKGQRAFKTRGGCSVLVLSLCCSWIYSSFRGTVGCRADLLACWPWFSLQKPSLSSLNWALKQHKPAQGRTQSAWLMLVVAEHSCLRVSRQIIYPNSP